MPSGSNRFCADQSVRDHRGGPGWQLGGGGSRGPRPAAGAFAPLDARCRRRARDRPAVCGSRLQPGARRSHVQHGASALQQSGCRILSDSRRLEHCGTIVRTWKRSIGGRRQRSPCQNILGRRAGGDRPGGKFPRTNVRARAWRGGSSASTEIGVQTGTVVGVVPTLQSLDVGVPDGPTLIFRSWTRI